MSARVPTRDWHASPLATSRLGMWVFLASEVLFFGVLIVAYGASRHGNTAAFMAASSHTDAVSGTINTAVLLTSSLTVALAVEAEKRLLRRVARRALLTAIALGCVFLVIKGFEYHREWTEGLFPGPAFHIDGIAADQLSGAELFYMWMFFATSLHALHLLIGMGWLATLSRGGRHAADLPQVTVAGLYWHFVDVVWIFLYPLIYLAGPHA